MIDPKNPRTLYANQGGRIYKSEDGGANWNLLSRVPGDSETELFIDPITTTTLYTKNRDGIFFKSADGGMSWKTVNPGNTGESSGSIRAFAIDPANPSTLYASTSRPESSDVFVAKLNAAGTALVYWTWFGGAGAEASSSIAVDAGGNVSVAGGTGSLDFPLVNAAQTAPGSSVSGFVARLNASGSELIYSTYLGDGVRRLAGDAPGNTYVAGVVKSPEFPVTQGAFQTIYKGSGDGFVAKLNPAGALLYATYLGGGASDEATCIAIDGGGNAYVAGQTASDDFASTPGAFRFSDKGIFVVKLNASGSALLYSARLGTAAVSDIAVDSPGNAYVTGTTDGVNPFPTTPGALQQTASSYRNLFVTKLNAGGTDLIYSALLGSLGHGSRGGFGGSSGIAVDSAGNAYVTGSTVLNGFPITSDAAQTDSFAGQCRLSPGTPPFPIYCTDAFVSILNASGSALLYSTYLGGREHDSGGDIAVDAAGAVYVVGSTSSTDFPVTSGSFQTSFAGERKEFIAKFVPGGAGNRVTSASAASFRGGEIAPDSIVAAFGSKLATATAGAATIPLPDTLEGTTARVRDSAGGMFTAPLFFVSPAQVNYLMPAGTARGDAAVTITSGGNVISSGTIKIVPVAPGIFAADASGQGIAAAVVLRVRQDGSQRFEPVVRFDTAENRFVAIPIDLGVETDQVFLLLFGTGIRFRNAVSAVNVKVSGVETPVNFAGAQGTLVGVDQINARLPRTLAGKGEVDVVVTVDGKVANTTRVNIK